MGSINKSIKVSHLIRHREADHITNLHEDVLSNILSRLPTKDAVRTCVLSKDWICKWTSSYNVDVDDGTSLKLDPCTGMVFYRQPCPRMFADFMERVLRFGKHLKGFRLRCWTKYDLERVQTWISTALKHNLESVHVMCENRVTYPDNLLNNTSLRKLYLDYCNLNVAPNNVAASLTSVDLWRVKFVNADPNTSTLTFTFPVLETFSVTSCEWLNMKYVEINAPQLTTFMTKPHLRSDDYNYSYVVVTPRLATLRCEYGIPEEIILDGSSVVTATLRGKSSVDDHDHQLITKIGLRVGKLLNGLTSLKKLRLTRYIAEVSQFGPPLRCHDKLERLEIFGLCESGLPFHILHAAPSLKFLRFNCYELGEYDYGKIETVPRCIVSQLEEVTFDGFCCEPQDNLENQYNLVKFLLENGERLHKIHRTRIKREEREQVTDIILRLPRRSPCLVVA